MAEIIEHEILGILYNKVSFYLTKAASIPIYKRSINFSALHFGTLVDILNNPEKYTKAEKKSDEGFGSLSKKILKDEEIEIKKYDYHQVSNAIDILSLNGHVEDKVNGDGFINEITIRRIILMPKGAIDFRNEYYILETKKHLSERRDLWQKRNWLIAEPIKFLMAGIIGALIALAVTRIHI